MSFFEEQARHRRETWRIVAACALIVLVMGVVTSVDLAPIFLAVVVLGSDLVNYAVPMPDLLTITLSWLHTIVHAPAFNGPNVIWQQVPYAAIALTIAIASIPGVLMLAGIARAQRSLFARAGVGGTLLALGARDPKPGDLEEHQLVNIVGEMAIAANLPPPRVLLLDADVCNAAVVGSSPSDATVVVSRRLLDEFNREETEGVLGHLIGSIGNGDLKIAFDILSVFTTYGTLMALLDAPFGTTARGLLGRMSHLRSGNQSAELDSMMRLLVQETQNSEDIAPKTRTGGCVYWLLQPLVWANLMVKYMMFACVCLILAPLIAWLWRTRRYLADSTAVQLTRDPDGLASALQRLSQSGGIPPGGAWASHLFIVRGDGSKHWRGPIPPPPPAEVQRIRAEVAQRMLQGRAQGKSPQQIRQELMDLAEKEHMTEYVKAFEAERQSDRSGSDDKSSLESIVGGGNFHPAVDKRMRRLQAQGSTVAPPEKKRQKWGPAGIVFVTILCLILAPLIAALVVLIPLVGFMLGMLAIIVDMMWFAILVVPLHTLLRHFHH